MDINEMKELIAAVDQSSIQEFEANDQDYAIRISKLTEPKPIITGGMLTNPNDITDQPVASSVSSLDQTYVNQPEVNQAAESAVSNGTLIKSPIVGVVYLQPAPDKDVFKEVGDSVREGETLCIVEAMKLMNEIPSTVAGKVAKVLVENGQVVEYDQPLFEII
ncbi:hypothetical protein AWM75_00145 [Aerococcus urinaehominis]|uniref:Biotin carboxyl carrier protein of acetyl-CoA carboxylase n=1 Tax=Aerococcus urinaehominis TaxID=128944 RepID=A0A0X8FJI3_9LACT|nr:acetyl-CoA carboxylase biotin carboxyl carrier protein [Aerococcus urinaehominis]AMB98495.1 hypothetical protein AWM75_00145 [Aerococcus urinaehominis]SDL80783.1 acetyl-CoA carboxylase biotin carboxyl carrier protein [Aerococcus urinaehominis]